MSVALNHKITAKSNYSLRNEPLSGMRESNAGLFACWRCVCCSCCCSVFPSFFTVAAKCIAATAKQPRNNINPHVRIYVQIYVHLTHGQIHAHVCSVHLLPGRWQRTPTFNNDGCIVGPLHLSLLAVLTVRRSRP